MGGIKQTKRHKWNQILRVPPCKAHVSPWEAHLPPCLHVRQMCCASMWNRHASLWVTFASLRGTFAFLWGWGASMLSRCASLWDTCAFLRGMFAFMWGWGASMWGGNTVTLKVKNDLTAQVTLIYMVKRFRIRSGIRIFRLKKKFLTKIRKDPFSEGFWTIVPKPSNLHGWSY